MTKRPSVLEPLRARIRRLQLIVGSGFLAVILGAVFMPMIEARIAERITGPSAFWEVFFAALWQMWAWAILPALLYGLARVLELRPWSTSIGGVLTGMFFLLALQFLSRGTELLSSLPTAAMVTRFVTAVGAVFICRWAIGAARASAARADQQAKVKAEARKDEYAEFIREAERVAALREGPAAVTVTDAAPAPVAGSDAAPAPATGAAPSAIADSAPVTVADEAPPAAQEPSPAPVADASPTSPSDAESSPGATPPPQKPPNEA